MQGYLLWLFTYCINALVIIKIALLERNFKNKDQLLNEKYKYLVAPLVCCFLPMFLGNDDNTAKAAISMAAPFYFFKTLEACLQDRFKDEPIHIRVISCIGSFMDIQTRKPGKELLVPRLYEIFELLMSLALDIFGLYTCVGIILNNVNSSNPFRFFLAVVAADFYAMFALQAFGHFIQSLWLITLGFKLEPLMLKPYLSKTLTQFWGYSWDTAIQKLLKKYVFRNLIKIQVNQILAAFITFFCSGLIHVLPIFTVLNDYVAGAYMMTYFLIQFILMSVERELKVKKWSELQARIWTAACLFLPSYFLVIPVFKLAQLM